ncbi:hypothetical protein M0R45_032868 [Rubus argutus]|uniref:Acid phosphatase/vanadium-dependent haloperoxidase-related protein n=1 Tax=Rubus argutus TaxID=59490 RepID=A0AAW1WID1_RUBAR
MDEVMTAADATSGGATASSSPSTAAIPANLALISAFLACAVAQFLKLFTSWYKIGDGIRKECWIPAECHQGTGGAAFAIALVLSLIVMYDATGVRLHAGRQAELLNQIVCELPPEHPLSTVRPLRDSLGHTPVQVVAGAILGCIVAYLMRVV